MKKIIFIHCPKTGGCSISKMIGGCHAKQQNNNVMDGHRTLLYYKQNFKIKNYFIFSITRNPWDRMVSCYNYVKNRIDAKENKAKLLGQEFKVEDLNGAFWLRQKHKTFEDFIINLYEIYSSRGLGNILPSLKNKGPDPGLKNIIDCISVNNKVGVDFIINLHTIKDDWPILNKILGFSSEVLHINKSIHDDYKNYYKNDKLIDIVEEIYKPDINYFNFKFEDKNYSQFDRIINKSLFLDKKYA